jgi:spermidine synthase
MSSFFAQLGVIDRTTHRKFWNVLLLSTFLITGFIGLVMVIKINYKLVIPFFDDLVKYHVDFGIGMAVIGFIHFWWHLSYYLNLFKRKSSGASDQTNELTADLDELHLKFFALLLGSTSLIAQILLLREFLSVFNGNELVIGLVLANWMVLTGIGALVGRKQLRGINPSTVILTGQLALSVMPFIIMFLISFLKNRIFPVGAMISIFEIFFASLLLLIPFCLLSGFLFTFISTCYSRIRNQNETGSVYGFESAGSIIGSLLTGFLCLFIFSSAESLLALTLVNSLLILKICMNRGTTKLVWFSALFAAAAFVLLLFQPEKLIRGWVYPNQKIVVSKDSPQGNIVITRQEQVWSVYNNNILQFDSENFMMNEEAVHFAMVQHPDPVHILLVSGGLSGQITELEKYKAVTIDYVEENRWLLTLMKDSVEKIKRKGVTIISTDPLRFIRSAKKQYDVVLLNLPGPSTLQSNRLYTLEFFDLLKHKLSAGAVISLGLSAPPNYLNKESVELNSTIYSTLKNVFKNVIIIPGEKNYFVASDTILTSGIAKAVQDKGIETRYVNQFYFNDEWLKARGNNILLSLNPAAEINQNLKPVLYRQQLDYWLSHFKGRYRTFGVMAIAFGLILFLTGGIRSKAIFLTGFSASGMEIILLFGLQIYFGNIYLLTSFIFTSFMVGLTVGSFHGKSLSCTPKYNYLAINTLVMAGSAAIIPLILFSPAMSQWTPAIVYAVYFGATMLIGGLTGIQFTLTTLNRPDSYGEISGKTYSYDLFGSAIGALVVTLYLVPGTGIMVSVLAISFLNLVFGIYLTLRKRII